MASLARKPCVSSVAQIRAVSVARQIRGQVLGGHSLNEHDVDSTGRYPRDEIGFPVQDASTCTAMRPTMEKLRVLRDSHGPRARNHGASIRAGPYGRPFRVKSNFLIDSVLDDSEEGGGRL